MRSHVSQKETLVGRGRSFQKPSVVLLAWTIFAALLVHSLVVKTKCQSQLIHFRKNGIRTSGVKDARALQCHQD